jgi:hypothetical protein
MGSGSVTQHPTESVCYYNKRYFTIRNTIADVDDRDIIHYIHQDHHNIELWGKMFESNPKTDAEITMVSILSEQRIYNDAS